MAVDLSSIVPAYDPRAVEATFEWLRTVEKPGHEVAAWAEFNADGSHSRTMNSYCNALIQSCAYVACRPTKKVADETSRRYLDWLFNRSYAAAYAMRPDDDFGIERGFILSGNLPSNLLVSILIAARQWSEHPQLVALMFEMVDTFGCSEDLAFALTYSVMFTGLDVNQNHFPMSVSSPEYVRNFLDRRVVGELTRPLVKSNNYRRIFAMWGKSAYTPDMFKQFTKLVKSDVKRGSVVIPNPFAPVAKVSRYETTYTTKEQFFALVPKLTEIFDNAKRIESHRLVA